MYLVMVVALAQSLELDTSVVFVKTLTIVKFVRKEEDMNIPLLKLLSQRMYLALLPLLLMKTNLKYSLLHTNSNKMNNSANNVIVIGETISEEVVMKEVNGKVVVKEANGNTIEEVDEDIIGVIIGKMLLINLLILLNNLLTQPTKVRNPKMKKQNKVMVVMVAGDKENGESKELKL